MDRGQILKDYRMAKNHKKQIPILAELNACDEQAIIEILNEAGYKQMFNTNGVDISVKQAEMADKYEKAQVTIRCRSEAKCARVYERARRDAGCSNDGTR